MFKYLNRFCYDLLFLSNKPLDLIKLFYYYTTTIMQCNSVSLIKFYLIILNYYLINKNKTERIYNISRFYVVESKKSLIKNQVLE